MQEKYTKDQYRYYKDLAKDLDVSFYSEDLTGLGFDYNGVSVAFAKCIDSDSCRMLEVAVSYCAPEDEFNSKHGKFQALSNMFGCKEVVKLPLGQFLGAWGTRETSRFLLDHFSV